MINIVCEIACKWPCSVDGFEKFTLHHVFLFLLIYPSPWTLAYLEKQLSLLFGIVSVDIIPAQFHFLDNLTFRFSLTHFSCIPFESQFFYGPIMKLDQARWSMHFITYENSVLFLRLNQNENFAYLNEFSSVKSFCRTQNLVRLNNCLVRLNSCFVRVWIVVLCAFE